MKAILKKMGMGGECRADLHLHSRHSDRPSEWFLRRVGAPESYVDPQQLYQTCRHRGMDYVTITDHNTLDGALEIAHLPGTFLSVEVTTYFPEDGCKIHCLVWGITERSFADIQQARENIYDLRSYLNEHDITHAVAHPLLRINNRLTCEHIEKLILLFKRFEITNGARLIQAGLTMQAILDHLTPETIEQLADKHGIAPTGAEPWKKYYTGGSDDHSGLYSAETHTVTPRATTVFDYLDYLRAGEHRPAGRAGTSPRLAHSLYQIAFQYYQAHFAKQQGDFDLLGMVLMKVAGLSLTERKLISKRSLIPQPLLRFYIERKKKNLNDIEKLLIEEFTALRNRGGLQRSATRGDDGYAGFKHACRIGHQLTFAFLSRFFAHLKKGELLESIQAISSLGPMLLGMTPYLTAFGAQHKDQAFLHAVEEHFPGARSIRPRRRIAWFTDTFTDINGVTRTIRELTARAYAAGEDIRVVTCLPGEPEADFPLRNFEPVGVFKLPEYETMDAYFPPFLDIFEFLEQENITEVVISTPGPVGIAAMTGAKLFNLTLKGIYHTDFPRYMVHFTQDEMIEDAAWQYMHWFYGGMNTVFAPSQAYADQLIAHGFREDQVKILTRGVNLEQFNPAKQQDGYWERFGVNGGFKFLYVGRVSTEKNIENMIEAFRIFAKAHPDAYLIIVGDGPHKDQLEKQYGDDRIIFTGHLEGDDLAGAFAGADVFVFPSMTDTFGNAVLEAHASGLPAIVSDHGGPAEIVASHGSGISMRADKPAVFAEAMRTLHADEALRRKMAAQALERAKVSRWNLALEQFLRPMPTEADNE